MLDDVFYEVQVYFNNKWRAIAKETTQKKAEKEYSLAINRAPNLSTRIVKIKVVKEWTGAST